MLNWLFAPLLAGTYEKIAAINSRKRTTAWSGPNDDIIVLLGCCSVGEFATREQGGEKRVYHGAFS